MQTQKITVTFRTLLAISIIAISYLATTSRSIPVVENVNDKIEHAFAFFTLALLVDFSWPKSGFNLRKFLSLLGYGLAIEITQYFLPSRDCSVFDLGADAAGLCLYWIVLPVLKNVLLLNLRWKAGNGPN